MHLLTLIFGIVLLPGGKSYTLKCNRCLPTSAGTCINTVKTCPSGYKCVSQRITSYAGGAELTHVNMRSCVAEEQCGESSINIGVSRYVITAKCCPSDLCNTQDAPEPSRSSANGKTCYHCNGPTCSAVLECKGNEDHCITKTVISEGEKKIVKGCASKQMCLSTVNAAIKGTIGGTLSCCQGNLCNSASSTSAGLLLLVAPLVSLVMFS